MPFYMPLGKIKDIAWPEGVHLFSAVELALGHGVGGFEFLDGEGFDHV